MLSFLIIILVHILSRIFCGFHLPRWLLCLRTSSLATVAIQLFSRPASMCAIQSRFTWKVFACLGERTARQAPPPQSLRPSKSLSSRANASFRAHPFEHSQVLKYLTLGQLCGSILAPTHWFWVVSTRGRRKGGVCFPCGPAKSINSLLTRTRLKRQPPSKTCLTTL